MHAPKPAPIILTCPDCSGESPLAEADLVPGLMLACPHCGTELALAHDRDVPDDPPAWRLEIPDAAEDAGRSAP